MNPFDDLTIPSTSIEQYLEEQSIIMGDSKVKAAIVRYLNKRGKCVMNISTIINLVENG